MSWMTGTGATSPLNTLAISYIADEAYGVNMSKKLFG
jgi:hypothetical protein